MEDHAILSERLEDQLKAVEWAKAEQKRILKEKGERLSKELMKKMTPFILISRKNRNFLVLRYPFGSILVLKAPKTKKILHKDIDFRDKQGSIDRNTEGKAAI